MTNVAVLGGGAFGTALAIALARGGGDVVMWSRNIEDVRAMQESRSSHGRLPGHGLPETLRVTADLHDAEAEVQLLAVPMQATAAFLEDTETATAPYLVACMKGIDLASGERPSELLARLRPNVTAAILTGPSFAADIALGLPTALTLACTDSAAGRELQNRLSTGTIRLYRTSDVVGAELGGALKNVIALAAGIAIGAGYGDSARAALIARGMAEISRIAAHHGAKPTTLSGLSGLGDLVLTATSQKSRNYTAGLALGRGEPLPTATIEGIATARAMAAAARRKGLDAPITLTVAEILDGNLAVPAAVDTLLARPLKEE